MAVVSWVRRLSTVGVVLALVGLALAMLPPWSWVSELADPWRLHVALLLGVLSLGLGRPKATAALILLSVVVSIPPLASRFGARPTPTGARTLTLVTLNLERDNPHKERAVAWLQATGADVLVFEEVDPAWGDALASIRGYPYRVVLPEVGHFGVALLSQLPVMDADVVPTGSIPTRTLVASVGEGDAPLRVLVTHTMPPLTPGHAEERSRDLADVAELVGPGPRRTVLAGDLNAPPWAPSIKDFLARTGLADSGRGFGLQPTWPAPLAPLGIPIDHVLVSPDVSVVAREVGPDLGSDHRPVTVTLRW